MALILRLKLGSCLGSKTEIDSDTFVNGLDLEQRVKYFFCINTNVELSFKTIF